MRILSCHIAGFGRFVHKDFDFSAELTVIKEDNGWGKTTLADFIRCMLYGLDGGRNKSVSANDRMRYEPWSGGVFGGSLDFVYGGRKYRVERSFGKTPAYDSVRVYDSNNMLCYDFGDRAERLGETLFGVDSESYRRSVYIPQGEIRTGSLPDDMKNRLLSLLGDGGQGANGAQLAVERLDAADRALRARRKPAKGKLDEIDERLTLIARQKAACDDSANRAKGLREELLNAEKEISACNGELAQLNAAIEDLSRQNEFSARNQTRREIEIQLDSANAELARLREFFGETDPATVNTEGLQNAVTEYYAVKTQLEDKQKTLSRTETSTKEKAAVEMQINACEKVLQSYGALLPDGENSEAGTRRKVKKGKKIIPPRRKSTNFILFVSLFLALLGAIWLETKPIVGLVLLAVGGIGMAWMFMRLMPRREKIVVEERQARPAISDEAIKAECERTQAELTALRAKLAAFPPETEQNAALLTECSQLQNRELALERGICNFLDNFRFPELYDYRAAVTLLKEKIEAHAKAARSKTDYEKRLKEYGNSAEMRPVYANNGDIEDLKARKAALERRKEEYAETRARALSNAENLETQADKQSLLAEETWLTEEKARLEKRHRAIVGAKQLLLRAQENMATRYLDPVERGSRYYFGLLQNAGNRALRFAADGTPLMEDGGKLRELEYYSAGGKELVGFCTRIALADAVFQKEPPVLVLDDPFVNLDDDKTERVKKLVKELTKRYQIIYLTCKNERKL
ncbi:MAG: AAA family ATPase [Clostridia bacterium]|nr:AAA family ATPase [Clostridia bacterium]